jgi:hypothetical protein
MLSHRCGATRHGGGVVRKRRGPQASRTNLSHGSRGGAAHAVAISIRSRTAPIWRTARSIPSRRGREMHRPRITRWIELRPRSPGPILNGSPPSLATPKARALRGVIYHRNNETYHRSDQIIMGSKDGSASACSVEIAGSSVPRPKINKIKCLKRLSSAIVGLG